MKINVRNGSKRTNNWIFARENEVKKLLRGSDPYKKGVSPSYFLNAMGNNPIRYIMTNSNRLTGIALVRNVGNWNRLVNVIAAEKGRGRQLLNKIKLNFQSSGRSRLRVKSTNAARNFYIKHGFTPTRNTKNANGLWRMAWMVPEYYGPYRGVKYSLNHVYW
jgi:hypothetical protein